MPAVHAPFWKIGLRSLVEVIEPGLAENSLSVVCCRWSLMLGGRHASFVSGSEMGVGWRGPLWPTAGRARGEMRVYCSRKGFWDAAAMDIAA
jgi:hypothetical protein